MSRPPPASRSTHEEPEITQEESVPSDGRDIEGERLMKEVGNRKLQDQGDAEHKTPAKVRTEPDMQPDTRRGENDDKQDRD